MDLELGEIRLFKEYNWDDLHEFIYWKELELTPSRIALHEGQKVAYFSLEQINTMKLAFHYNEVLREFYHFVVETL
jgi:8-oxo-dGTP diphosphatase